MITAPTAPEGFRDARLHSQGRWAAVYLAVREADGQEVVLKIYPGDAGGSDRSRALRERDAFLAVAGPGVPRCLDLIESPPMRTLVLERSPGVQLARWVRDAIPETREVLEVSVQLAQTLARVHQAHILHSDLTPANVIVDPASLRAHLVDFGLARPLGSVTRPAEARSSVNAVAMGLHFIAPEQTGRMGRGIDFRSDLYNLGATLYYMLTGATLFEGEDPLALIHAHMARVPPSPRERRPEVPSALSHITMKLLEKEPEERYQTAQALARDLALCRDRLEQQGSIGDDFELGRGDRNARPVFHQRLYGRGDEMAALRGALERAVERSGEHVRLTGPAGVGKSALVRELRSRLTGQGGYLVSGKFDRYRRDQPYAGFAQAVDALAHQILVESEASLERWREQLVAALGSLGGVLTGLVPDFVHILGETEPVPPLPPRETRARLALTVQRLLHACATAERPLALFLDDCQWADAGSQYLLEDLTLELERRAPGLLLITAYRDQDGEVAPESGTSHRTAGTHIEVGPIGAAVCAEMLADALHSTPEETLPLAECIVRKSGGSPLVSQQLVLHLYEIGHIYCKDDRWEWDVEPILREDLPEGAIDLLLAKTQRLEPAARELLRVVSCVGDRFDSGLLSELSGRPRAELEPSLFVLIEEGLVLPDSGGLRFAHDRIREAAQALLDPQEHSRLHERMGWLLADSTPEPELPARALEIADHLLASAVAPPEERRSRARSLYRLAGQQSLGAGAGTTATRYLTAARELLRADEIPSLLDESFGLFMESAEAAVQADRPEEALALLDQLEPHTVHDMQWAQLVARRIAIFGFLPGRDPVALALDAARRFGLHTARNPPRWRVTLDLWRTDWALRGTLDEEAFALKGTDISWIPPLLVIATGIAAMMRENLALTCTVQTWGIRRLRRHGAFRNPAAALAGYAAFRAAYRRDLEGVHRYVRVTQEFAARRPMDGTKPRYQFILYAYLLAWIGPRRSVLDRLRQLIEDAREAGDLDMRDFTTIYLGDYSALSGEPLSRVAEVFDAVRRFPPVQGQRAPSAAQANLYGVLHERPTSSSAWKARIAAIDAQFDQSEDLNVTYWVGWIHWLVVLVVLGRFDRAFACAERLVPVSRAVGTPGASLSDYVLLHGLSAVAQGASAPQRRHRLRTARACLRQLRTWARHAPDCQHMHTLLHAEILRMRRRPKPALAAYEAAARTASEAGHIQYAALAHERRASLLSEQRRGWDSTRALKAAIELYERWEARVKVAELRERDLRRAG